MKVHSLVKIFTNGANMSGIAVTFCIETCIDCHHKGHSGAFTPGGSVPVCDHDDACYSFTKNRELVDMYHWRHRKLNLDKEPPAKCPLRHGSKY